MASPHVLRGTLKDSARQGPGRGQECVVITGGTLEPAKLERGKITLTPKSVVDRAIAEGLEDIRKGRVFGPFSSAKDMVEDLHRRTKKRKRAP